MVLDRYVLVMLANLCVSVDAPNFVNFHKIICFVNSDKPECPVNSSTLRHPVNSNNFVLPVDIHTVDSNKPLHPVNSSNVRPVYVHKPIPSENSNKIVCTVNSNNCKF